MNIYKSEGSFSSSARLGRVLKWMLIIVLAIGGFSRAENWPAYRHDNARSGACGESLKPPFSLAWVYDSPHKPKPAWPMPFEELPKTHPDNAYHSIIAEGTVYFGSSIDNMVYAVDLKSGTVKWRFATEGPIRFAPTWWDGKIYVGSDDGFAYCIDGQTGKLIWRYRGGPSDEKIVGNGRMVSMWPVRTGVIVADGIAYFGAGVFPYEGLYICAANAKDGSIIWKNDTVGDLAHYIGAGGISPFGYMVASKKNLYVASGRSTMARFSRSTGEFLGQLGAMFKSGGTWALIHNDLLIAGDEAERKPHKMAYDAETGRSKGQAYAWFPGKDMVVTDKVSYVLTEDGVLAIDREHYNLATDDEKSVGRQLKIYESRLTELKVKLNDGPNLITNPGFEAGRTGWTISKDNAYINEVSAHSGKVGVELDALGLDGGTYGSSNLLEVEAGVRYSIYAYIRKAQEHKSGGHLFAVSWLNSDKQQISIDMGWSSSVTTYYTIRGGEYIAPEKACFAGIQIAAAPNCHAYMDDFVFSRTGTGDPNEKTKEQLTSKIREIEKKLDSLKAQQAKLKQSPCLWRYENNQLGCLRLAGNTVLVGGVNKVLAIEADTGKVLWETTVDGKANSIAVSDGRFTVSTDTGNVYCFGAGQQTESVSVNSSIAFPEENEEKNIDVYSDAAGQILKQAGVNKGFALVFDLDEGRLVYELAKQSDLKIVAIEKDPKKLTKLRGIIEKQGLLGARVIIEPWDVSALPNYFANLIVSEKAVLTGKVSGDPEQLYRVLRPCGGTVVFGQPKKFWGFFRKFKRDRVLKWLDGWGPEKAHRINDDGYWAVLTRSKLPGASEWTHQYANPQNTACSMDDLVKTPLGVLWYGEPGPQFMVERHGRSPCPVAMDGRLFHQGEEVIWCVDAYNGTLLWERRIPGVVRVRVDADSSNMVISKEGLFLAADDKCYRLDTRTGKTLDIFDMPTSNDGKPRRWGYLGVDNGILYGSMAKPFRKGYHEIWNTFVKDGKWAPVEEVPESYLPYYKLCAEKYDVPNDTARAELAFWGVLWRGMTDFPQWDTLVDPRSELSFKILTGDAIFALDAVTGKELWVHRGSRIPAISITIGDNKLFFTELEVDESHKKLASEQTSKFIKEGVYELDNDYGEKGLNVDVRLVTTLDAATGQQLWSKPIDLSSCGGDRLGSAYSDGLCLFFGNYSNHDTHFFREGKLNYRRIAAISAGDGKMVWSKPLNFRRRPAIVADKILIEPRACDLHTGKIKTRQHPITDKPVTWEFLRPAKSCGPVTASAHCMVYRSHTTAIYDFQADNGLQYFGAVRPGCWVNSIFADGLMLQPVADSGCICTYPIKASFALTHKPHKKPGYWTVFITHGDMTPAKHFAVNFGAPGDMKDGNGRLWFSYPRPKISRQPEAEKEPYGVKFDLNEKVLGGMGFFCRDFRGQEYDGTDKPWLFTSGCMGLERCQIRLIDDTLKQKSGVYTVRVGFKALPGDMAGRRIFDVKLQGKVVLKDFDILKASQTSQSVVIKEFNGIEVKNDLVLEMSAKAVNPGANEAPIINFIEAIRAD